MGLFNLFGNKEQAKKEHKVLPWQKLSEVHQIAEIANSSKQRPAIIFKHSTSCGISRMVLRNFESSYEINPEAADLYYLDLLAFRGVSNEVVAQFQVIHQSPQVLVIKNGQAVFHASHHGIHAQELENFI